MVRMAADGMVTWVGWGLVLSMLVVSWLPEQSALDTQIETFLLWRRMVRWSLVLSTASAKQVTCSQHRYQTYSGIVLVGECHCGCGVLVSLQIERHVVHITTRMSQ